jgi:hypothetical protein
LRSNLPVLIRAKGRDFVPRSDQGVLEYFSDLQFSLDETLRLLDDANAADYIANKVMGLAAFKYLSSRKGIHVVGALLGMVKPWDEIAGHLNRDKKELINTLDDTVKRRNDIVHRADRSQSTPAATPRRSPSPGRSTPWTPSATSAWRWTSWPRGAWQSTRTLERLSGLTMDKALRSLLYTAVVKCRALLEEDLGLQLEGAYGVHGDGRVEPLAGLTHLDAVGRADRQAVEAALRHFEAAGGNRQQAVERFVRESAYTVLNRLAALKLMEHPSRALIQPSVGAGDRPGASHNSALVSPEAMRSQPDGGYRRYLELLCDDLARIPVLAGLFDRSLPTSLLFPTQPCLHEVLSLLNDPQLEAAWGEDETIGWSYQYFTPGRAARSGAQGIQRAAQQLRVGIPQPVLHASLRRTLSGGQHAGPAVVADDGRATRDLAQVCTYLIRPDRATNGECRGV